MHDGTVRFRPQAVRVEEVRPWLQSATNPKLMEVAFAIEDWCAVESILLRTSIARRARVMPAGVVFLVV